jgi:molecular chaperone GrpE
MDIEEKKNENSVSEDPTKQNTCEQEREEYLNGWKRAKADLINYQKEEAKRLEEFAKFSSLRVLEDLIPVLDSFDLAISMMEKEGTTEKGVYMIRTQLEDVLKKQGLERVPFQAGALFDPKLHESVGEIESTHPPGTLAEEIERGYSMQGRVVRPVRVKLAKGKI